MLTGGIFDAYCNGVARLSSSPSVSQVAAGKDGTPNQAAAALFETTAAAFLANPELQEEVFGASGLIVRCRDDEELRTVVGSLEGQLTIALHVDAGDIGAAKPMISQLELLAGRLLVNGFERGSRYPRPWSMADPIQPHRTGDRRPSARWPSIASCARSPIRTF